MKLSMSMLAEYLSAYQPECHIRDDTVCIQGIRFLSDRHPERSLDYVYIGSASSFFQDPRFQDAVILANGHNQILCHSADEEDLLNDVLSAFDFYQSLQQSLYEKSLRHAPIGAMLQDAGKVYRGALLLFDLEGSVIASSHEEVLKDPDLKGLSDVRGRGRSLGTGAISHTFVDRYGRISHDLTGKPQLLHIKGAETDQPGCVCLYLVQNDENVGFMLYFPLTEEEARTGLQTAEEWTGYFAQAEEFTAVSSYRQSDHEIFRKLLAGENVPSAVIGKLRKHALQDGNLCLILYGSRAIRNYTFRKMLAKDIEQLPVPCIAGEAGEYTAVLTAPEDVEKVLGLITASIPSENTFVGVSMMMYDLKDTKTAYEQALFALQYDTGPGIRYCRDLAPHFLLESLRENEQAGHLLHPAVRILLAYDRREKTELMETLRAYASSGWHQGTAAARIHIHLNTLKYRLKRITELTGVSFRDPSENFYLQLSLMLEEEKR